ncbi:ATP-binding cassette domain-containing protein [Klebsiella grimontii]|uniref:ATP-binding cassette domain-containing protein n=1 Tax=Klebsiella grimontii TaxID=2058152 RepID=UPI0015B0A91C|nr:ATP-binding cassette domain-containing protein [Klebsiella grimontii]
MMRALTSIKLDGVSFAFGAHTVLNQIDLHIDAGSTVALLGPSGCGKSTLLRLLAGLTVPASGSIHFGDRLVAKAGWGMPPEQRIALARAIVAEPRVLLFDEPLSNLDSELRESLCIEMSRLLRQLGITAVYVTHDRREAELLADKIVHLSAGCVAAVRAVSSSSGEPA